MINFLNKKNQSFREKKLKVDLKKKITIYERANKFLLDL